MRNLLLLLVGIILFLIAYILYIPLLLTNFTLVGGWDYFRSSALDLDIYACREFRTLWNRILINKIETAYLFGRKGESISSCLGKNQQLGTLSRTGRLLVSILNFIEKNHCLISIMTEEEINS